MNYENTNELYHHGIKGMKWGVRRFQNKDGSLTPRGERHRKTLGETIHDYKVKRKRKQALEKARVTKAANKEAEAKRKEEVAKRIKAIERGKIPASKMTNEELQYAIARRKAEQDYNQKVLETNTGKRIVNKIILEGVVPGATDAAKNLVKDLLYKRGADLLGISKKEAKSAHDQIKEEWETSKWKKEKYSYDKQLKEMKKKDYEKALQEQEEAAKKKAAEKEAKKAEKEAKKAEKEAEKESSKSEKESKETKTETNTKTETETDNTSDTTRSYSETGETALSTMRENLFNKRASETNTESAKNAKVWVETIYGEHIVDLDDSYYREK